jgi:precorrin-6x reductase
MTRERKAAIRTRMERARVGSGDMPNWQEVRELLEALEATEEQRDKALVAIGAAWAALTMADLSLPQAPWASPPWGSLPPSPR